MVALRKESVDRNPDQRHSLCITAMSLSARRAWIEITTFRLKNLSKNVALRKESVDRNQYTSLPLYAQMVALRKESVDRNAPSTARPAHRTVALRKESVDRNCKQNILSSCHSLSLSARRAWIEMLLAMLMRSPIGGRSPQGERG